MHLRRLAITRIVLTLGALGLCTWLTTARATDKTIERARNKAEKPAIAPEAEQLFHRSSDYLTSLHAFSFVSDSVTEAVTQGGEKLQFPASSKVTVERPNHLRSDSIRVDADTSFYYDGTTATVFNREFNAYATAAAPLTIDQTVDFIRAKLGIDAPAADLLLSNPYQALMAGVTSGIDLGEEHIGNIPCHHLAFRGAKIDWQIWIKDGDQPLPLRYTIVTKDVTGMPTFSTDLHDWNINAPLTADTFSFKPPEGVDKIDFVTQAPEAKREPQRGKAK